MSFYGPSTLPLNPLVAALAALPSWETYGMSMPAQAAAGTPFVGSSPSYQVDTFQIGGADDSYCPGCTSGSGPANAAQAYPAVGASLAGNASPASVVDVNVDTAPLAILAALWLFFTFAKGK